MLLYKTHVFLFYYDTWQLEALTQSELASRLTLNCASDYVEPQKLMGIDITLIDVSMRSEGGTGHLIN